MTKGYIDKTKEAVDLLCDVFKDDIKVLANIHTAQAGITACRNDRISKQFQSLESYDTRFDNQLYMQRYRNHLDNQG